MWSSKKPSVAAPPSLQHSDEGNAPQQSNDNNDAGDASDNGPKQQGSFTKKLLASSTIISGIAFGAAVFYAATRFKIAGPSEYIVRTGIGISDISIGKKAVVWPFQRYEVLDITPKTFSFVLHAMSREKMEFQLPVQFTIGPYNEIDNLRNYSIRLSTIGRDKLEELVKGIIEGGTRSMAANLSIEEIFSDRIKFKSDIKASVQHDLDQFGLFIFNANIKELVDAEGSEYFVYLRQKTKENAINQSKIEVAEARLKGDVGEKERMALTRQQVSKIESETVVFENSRINEIKQSEAELEKRKALYSKEIQIARIEAQKAAAIRESELQRDVEIKRLEQETERLRAEKLSSAKVAAEALIQQAEGEANAQKRAADAQLYTKQKEAEAVYSYLNAQAEGFARIQNATGQDFNKVLSYMIQTRMLDENLYPQLAEMNAKAIQGLNPKITVWNTGNGGANGGAADPMKSFRDIYQSIPPLVNTIHEQTGISPPEWLLKLPKAETVPTPESKLPEAPIK